MITSIVEVAGESPSPINPDLVRVSPNVDELAALSHASLSPRRSRRTSAWPTLRRRAPHTRGPLVASTPHCRAARSHTSNTDPLRQRACHPSHMKLAPPPMSTAPPRGSALCPRPSTTPFTRELPPPPTKLPETSRGTLS
jgi:hypothetical protein